MSAGKMLLEIVVTAVIAFVVSAIVSVVWNLVAHGAASPDWETAVRLGVIFGIVVPLVVARGRTR